MSPKVFGILINYKMQTKTAMIFNFTLVIMAKIKQFTTNAGENVRKGGDYSMLMRWQIDADTMEIV